MQRRLIVAALLAIFLQGCMKWTVVGEPKTLALRPRHNVRVTTIAEGKRVIVKDPTISGDSIVWSNPERGGLPLSDVMWVEARSRDPITTGFIALVGVAVLVGVVLRQ